MSSEAEKAAFEQFVAGCRVQFRANERSPLDGQLSVLSPALDFCSFDVFWDGFYNLCHSPQSSGGFPGTYSVQTLVSEVNLIQHRISARAAALKGAFGWAHPIPDDTPVDFVLSNYFDRELGTIRQETSSPEGQVWRTVHLRLYREPFRIETWMVDPEFVAASGTLGFQMQAFLKDALKQANPGEDRVVKVESGVQSPDGSGRKVCLSDPLPDIDCAWLMEQIIESIKTAPKPVGVKSKDVEEMSDGSFVIISTMPPSFQPGRQKDYQIHAHHALDRAVMNGRLTITSKEDDAANPGATRCFKTSVLQLRNDPVRLEAWETHHARRRAGPQVYKEQIVAINGAMNLIAPVEGALGHR